MQHASEGWRLTGSPTTWHNSELKPESLVSFENRIRSPTTERESAHSDTGDRERTSHTAGAAQRRRRGIRGIQLRPRFDRRDHPQSRSGPGHLLRLLPGQTLRLRRTRPGPQPRTPQTHRGSRWRHRQPPRNGAGRAPSSFISELSGILDEASIQALPVSRRGRRVRPRRTS